MGTNYYWYETDTCPHCGRDCDPVHIGKSSCGWTFALHVYDDIKTLDDWQERWNQPGSIIKNEYGDKVSMEEMISIITERSRPTPCDWTLNTFQRNNALPGPNNLVRCRIDGERCIGHGEGTWDYIVGDFS